MTSEAIPYGIPEEVWLDIEVTKSNPSPSANRAKWVLDHCPEVDIAELTHVMALQQDELKRLDFKPQDGETQPGQQ
jgi:hypothetical protein